MSSEHQTRIRFFGRLADALGPQIEMALSPDCSIADLRRQIAGDFPDGGPAIQSRRVRACVGDTVVAEDYRVGPGDEVEFIPPVSGG